MIQLPMRKTLLLALVLFVFIGLTIAQKPEIVGTWLLERVEMDGEIQQVFMVNEFQTGGAMLMMGMEVATWKFNKKGNGIILKSDFDKDFEGEMLILSSTEKELVFDKDGAKHFYLKLNEAEIIAANINSGLFGTWEVQDCPYTELNTLLTFTEPSIARFSGPGWRQVWKKRAI